MGKGNETGKEKNQEKGKVKKPVAPRNISGLPERSALLEFIRSQGRHPSSLPVLQKAFSLSREEERDIKHMVKSLVGEGFLRKVKGNKFIAETEEDLARIRAKQAGKHSAAPSGTPEKVPAAAPALISGRLDAGDSPAVARPTTFPGRKVSKPIPDGVRGKRPGATAPAQAQGNFNVTDSSLTDRNAAAKKNPEDSVAGEAGLVKGKLIRQGGFHFVVPLRARSAGDRAGQEESRWGNREQRRGREKDRGRGPARGREGKKERFGKRGFPGAEAGAPEEGLVLIPRKHLGKARPGDLVIARITEEDGSERIGVIVSTLGEETPFTEVSKSFFREYGLPYGYPRDGMAEAGEFPEPVLENYPDRRDLRAIPIITIDPSTAKDHDDAISLERLANGTWRLGVHIADVSEYVTDDSALDHEAVARAFTQYLPWTAVPMLPQRLSSDLCSLLEGRERLAFSCMMDVTADGELRSFDFVETFIKVQRFYSYEEAQGAKQEGDPFLTLLDEFTTVLLKRRRDDGFIDFQFPEPKVELDDGVPVRIYPGTRLPSHSWIEECMLLANQATAKFLTKHKLPGLFRVHEQPDLDVVSELWASQGLIHRDKGMVDAFKELNQTKTNLNPAIQQFFIRLLSQEGGALPVAVQRKILQSMKKAQYSPEAQGHFALGWLHYAHFTSPIRRYADLWTHRVIKAFVRGEKIPKAQKAQAYDVAERISEREIAVMKVERKGLKTATAWVLKGYVGDAFIGEISGMENFGIFVSIQNPYGEGMIPIYRLRDDYYEKDEETGHMVGKRTRRRFQLGDKLHVRLERADPFTGQVDFDFLGIPE